jgi:twinkle protein|tara:strand:+ start:2656 stop:4320 length:1665 start_codon:yes stop_codon:yes gene_type:complete
MQEGWLNRGPCPQCGASKANVQHSDGHSFCFSCESRFSNTLDINMQTIPKENKVKYLAQSSPLKTDGYSDAIPSRAITLKTTKVYNTFVASKNSDTEQSHHIYKYMDSNGDHVASKIRTVKDKEFWIEGDISKAVLFGQDSFSKGGKYVTLCEGELDAMSAYEMLGSKWPVVSIKNGCKSAVNNCKQAFDFLDSFEKIVICFDTDAQGKEAAIQVAQLFEPNKCRIVSLDLKDPNEYIMINQRERFTKTWWAAESYTPAGIINLDSLGDSLYEENFCYSCPYPWEGLNKKTYGMRTGELVCFTSGAGMGKSSIMRELMHHILNNTEDNIGVLALEESVRNTIFNIMSVEANARLYIKEVRDQFDKEQLKDWQKKTIGTKRFFAFDHFGSISNDEILDRIRFMAKALDAKWIFLDHLSILVSGQEDNVDERKSIDILMTKLRSLVEETGISLLLVSHLRRPSGDRGHEDGREVSLSHLRGSASIAHLSDSVIALERNQQADNEFEANTTTIRILKNRYTGDTGIATYLHYDNETGRMTEVDSINEEDEDEYDQTL